MQAQQEGEDESDSDTDECEDAELESSADVCLTAEGSGCKGKGSVLKTVSEKIGLGEALSSTKEELVVGKKVLLGAAWCREDEKKPFQMFPEVLMVDVTMGTNNQGGPLAVTAAPGPDLKVFTLLRAFLPSECRWVFDWLFSTVTPLLMGPDTCRRIQLVLSDGDCKRHNAFDNCQEDHCPNCSALALHVSFGCKAHSRSQT